MRLYLTPRRLTGLFRWKRCLTLSKLQPIFRQVLKRKNHIKNRKIFFARSLKQINFNFTLIDNFKCQNFSHTVFCTFLKFEIFFQYFPKMCLADLEGIYFHRLGITSGTLPWELENIYVRIGRLGVKYD